MVDLLFRCFYAFIDLGFAVVVMALLFVFACFRLTYRLLGVSNDD